MSNIKKNKFVFVTAISIVLFLCAAVSAADFVTRPDNEYLILGANINGTPRNDGVEAYLPNQASPDKVLIPLRVLTNALGFPIDIDSGDGIASGWFIKEENTFGLDIKRAQVVVAGKTTALPEGGAEKHIDDIYVQAALLEQWFNLKISLDLSSLEIDVRTKDALPFEDKSNRLKKSQNNKKQGQRDNAYDKDAKILPYQNFSEPSLLLQQNISSMKTDGAVSLSSDSNIHGNMDLLGMGADYNFSYSADTNGKRNITSSTMTMEKRDPSEELLGFMGAGKVELGDISFPAAPLFSGAKRGAGVSVSSEYQRGYKYASQPDNYILDGDAPPGWDAELYRNGNYVDFQQIGNDGRFMFENVELSDGYNFFEILLFGREGQKKTITREVYRGANMLRAGEKYYNISAGTPDGDFLPFAEGRRDNTAIGVSAEYLHGITDTLTLGGSVYAGPEIRSLTTNPGIETADNDTFASSVSAAFSALGVNSQVQAMSTDDGRNAYGFSSRRRQWGINLISDYKVYQNFTDNDDLKKQSEIGVSRTFGKVDVGINAKDKTFVDLDKERIVENTLSANISGVRFTNKLGKTVESTSGNKDLSGELSLQTSAPNDVRLRGNIQYDLNNLQQNGIKRFEIFGQKNFASGKSLHAGGGYDFDSGTTNVNTRYTLDFEKFSMDINAGANTDNNYSIGVGLRTALQPQKDKTYAFSDPQKGSQASLGVRAYVDMNENDIFDNGDKPIEDIKIIASRGMASASTEKDGVAWLNGLVEMPTKFSVDMESVSDISHVPAHESTSLIPRRGANAVIDMPFKVLGEIDGFVKFDTPDKTDFSSVRIDLIDVKTNKTVRSVQSEYDGFFFFSAMPIGSYRVAAVDVNNPANTSEKEFILTSQKPTSLDVSLVLKSIENIQAPVSPVVIAAANTDNNKPSEDIQKLNSDETGTYWVHLGSLKDKDRATKEMYRLNSRYAGIVGDITMSVVRIRLWSGEYYHRVVAGPMSGRTALEICKKLIDQDNPGGCNLMHTTDTTDAEEGKKEKQKDENYRIHLSSYKNQKDAEEDVKKYTKMFPDILPEKYLTVVSANIDGKGVFYRVVGMYNIDRKKAKETCNALKTGGIDTECGVIK